MEEKIKKAESVKKEVDKEIIRAKIDATDLKVGSEEYSNACKSINSLADASLKLSNEKTSWAGILVPAGASFLGVIAMSIAERTMIVDNILKKVSNVKTLFRK